MLYRNFTIFSGPNGVGKSVLLFEIARLLKKELGMKLAFIGWTHEFSDASRSGRISGDFGMNTAEDIKKSFELVRFLSDSEDENAKMLALVSEIAVRDNYDYIFIDDICSGLMSRPFDSVQYRYIKALSEIPVKKVATHTVYQEPLLDDDALIDAADLKLRIESQISDLKTYSVDFNRSWKFDYKLRVDGNDYNDFARSVIREMKINRIIEKNN